MEDTGRIERADDRHHDPGALVDPGTPIADLSGMGVDHSVGKERALVPIEVAEDVVGVEVGMHHVAHL
jgi:hypothetical protein